MNVNYKVGDCGEQLLRVWLRKGEDGWKVARELDPNEVNRPQKKLME